MSALSSTNNGNGSFKVRGKILRITPKLDGASIICKFKNGKLEWAATRGDGYEGENITRKLVHMHFGVTGDCLLRGEVFLKGDLYKKIGMKNRRNGVVGILGRDDDQYVDMLNILFYEVIEGNSKNVFDYVDEYYCVSEILGSDLSMYDLEYTLKKFRNDIYPDIDQDGLVIEPIDYVRENVDRPKMKIAFKINEQPTRVTVTKVEWTTSRTGRIIPVIHFNPVLLSGATVTKATGFNAAFIQDNKIQNGTIIEIVPFCILLS